MLEKYPLNKAEILKYLLRLHQTDMHISKKFFEYLKMHNHANILEEAVQLKNMTSNCF